MPARLANILLTVGALVAALAVFGVFAGFAGVSPVQVWMLLFKGAFGDWFAWLCVLVSVILLLNTLRKKP